MKSRKLWMGLAFLVTTVVIALALVSLRKPFEAYGGRIFFHGKGTAFRYTGQGMDNGDIYVVVSVRVDDPEALLTYRDANVKRGRELINRGEAKPVWVQVTFNRPLPTDQVRALVGQTGFQVDSFLMVGRSSDGERMTHIHTGAIGDDVPDRANDPLWNDETTFAGIMLLQGKVEATEQGLGRWLTDERVYLVDTTGVEVRELVAQRHADVITDREIVVSLPSPFWQFDCW